LFKGLDRKLVIREQKIKDMWNYYMAKLTNEETTGITIHCVRLKKALQIVLGHGKSIKLWKIQKKHKAPGFSVIFPEML